MKKFEEGNSSNLNLPNSIDETLEPNDDVERDRSESNKRRKLETSTENEENISDAEDTAVVEGTEENDNDGHVLVERAEENNNNDGHALVRRNLRKSDNRFYTGCTGVDFEDDEVCDREAQWLNCFPEGRTSLTTLNLACLEREVDVTALERLVARSPDITSLEIRDSAFGDVALLAGVRNDLWGCKALAEKVLRLNLEAINEDDRSWIMSLLMMIGVVSKLYLYQMLVGPWRDAPDFVYTL
ncbi:protein auxin signaling F-box 2 [Phtheirospermum japonicum]|uniref:Protein auxin signaling F-box 2 n=1 Tax=Phtheirospermum japonicum TaxID=374723 RepID=A0A830CQ48_9LAMI|nr:protein auxin signaling F-box 2 [Phtheirospermum japonicum]